MTSMSDDLFHELALKCFLKQGSAQEAAELKAAVDEDPNRKLQLLKLKDEFIAIGELVSLIAATEATGPQPTPAARQRFRSVVAARYTRQPSSNRSHR